MTFKPILAAALALGLFTAPAFAQATAPVSPNAPKPPVAAQPTPPTKPVVPAPAAKVTKINLNTATVAELDALPQIGPARSKAIIDERTKAKFKSWKDFQTRKVVPANAETAIKDLVFVR